MTCRAPEIPRGPSQIAGAWRGDLGRTVPRSAIDAALHGVGARRGELSSPTSNEGLGTTAFPVLLGAPTIIATYE